MEWIVNAGVAGKLNLITTPEIPLAGMADHSYFKVYMSDVGLLRRKARLNYRTVLEGNKSYISFKGALTENYVYTELQSMGIDAYFWRSNANAELDFVTDYEGVLLPVEVKSADNTKAKSLQLFCKRYHPRMAIKTSLKNVGDNQEGETHIWSIPLYTLFRLKEYLYKEMNW